MPDLISDGEDMVIAGVKTGALNQDAFERYRISTPYTLFEFNSYQNLLFSNLFSYFDDASSGGGSVYHDNTRKSYVLYTGTASGSIAAAQTKCYWRYQSGKSQFFITSFLMNAAATNKRKRVGYFDLNDGIFFEQEGNGNLNIVLRSSVSGSVVERRIPQSSWSEDRLDGSGGQFNTSGITLDVTKTNLFVVDFQWLGVGLVRTGFDIDGKLYVTHIFKNANILDELYMSSGSLPIRYEVQNTGTSNTDTMEFMCGTVVTGGGAGIEDLYGISWAYSGVRSVSNETALISIQPKTSFKSNNNRTQIIPAELSIYSESRDILIKAYYNPIVSGGTYSNFNNDSACNVNSSATGFSGGRLILALAGSSDSKIDLSSGIMSNERLTTNWNATSADNILITAQSLSNSTPVHFGITWKEILR